MDGISGGGSGNCAGVCQQGAGGAGADAGAVGGFRDDAAQEAGGAETAPGMGADAGGGGRVPVVGAAVVFVCGDAHGCVADVVGGGDAAGSDRAQEQPVQLPDPIRAGDAVG